MGNVVGIEDGMRNVTCRKREDTLLEQELGKKTLELAEKDKKIQEIEVIYQYVDKGLIAENRELKDENKKLKDENSALEIKLNVISKSNTRLQTEVMNGSGYKSLEDAAINKIRNSKKGDKIYQEMNKKVGKSVRGSMGADAKNYKTMYGDEVKENESLKKQLDEANRKLDETNKKLDEAVTERDEILRVSKQISSKIDSVKSDTLQIKDIKVGISNIMSLLEQGDFSKAPKETQEAIDSLLSNKEDISRDIGIVYYLHKGVQQKQIATFYNISPSRITHMKKTKRIQDLIRAFESDFKDLGDLSDEYKDALNIERENGFSSYDSPEYVNNIR